MNCDEMPAGGERWSLTTASSFASLNEPALTRLTAFVFCTDGWTDQWMKQLGMRRLTIRYAVAQEI